MAKQIARIARLPERRLSRKFPRPAAEHSGLSGWRGPLHSYRGGSSRGRGSAGRPTDASWDRSPKVPMSRKTETKLAKLAATRQ